MSRTADAALHGSAMGHWYGIKWVSGLEVHPERNHILFTQASCLYIFIYYLQTLEVELASTSKGY